MPPDRIVTTRNLRPPEVNAHRMVAALAVEMAQSVWEDFCKDDVFYRNTERGHPKWRKRFVRLLAPQLRVAARGILAGMLARPDVAEDVKQQIWEALTLDRTLPKAGNSYQA